MRKNYLNGIIASSLLVFIPYVGECVIQELLGVPETLMIVKSLWHDFLSNRYFPEAFAMIVILLAILTLPILLFHHYRY